MITDRFTLKYYKMLKLPITFHSRFIDCLVILGLSFVVLFFLAVNLDNRTIFQDYLFCSGTFILVTSIVLLLRIAFPRLALLPILILLLLIPYSHFYTQLGDAYTINCLVLVLMGVFLFNTLIKDQPVLLRKPLSWRGLWVIVTLYVAFFATLSIMRHFNYQDASSFDVGIYCQIQWNNIHGRLLQTSISGSNNVTHNSPFLLLLSPLYALNPKPETLLFLKSLFIGLGAIPFYMIVRKWLDARVALPMVLTYLFYPFIVGQHINAPHETCFLTPFVLFSFYFYMQKNFRMFFVFLFIALTVKEHMALLCITYGLYSLMLKREKIWVIVPLFLGIAWAIFSMWVIHYFQQIYTSDPHPAWLIADIKGRFMPQNNLSLDSVIYGFQTSNFARFGQLILVYLILAPMAIILPFGSAVGLLGAPEILINLIGSFSLLYPTWHYMVVASCFLLIGAAATIRKMAQSLQAWQMRLTPQTTQELAAWLMCFCVAAHVFLWNEYLHIKHQPHYVATMNEAIGLVPRSASVSLNKYLVGYVTDRKDYFLLENPVKGDYIILDSTDKYDDLRGYTEIFNKSGIRVLKK